jgi:CheY-like chemotaxis protein
MSDTRVRRRILFVDDDEQLLRAIGRVLRSDTARWDMTFVVGGEKALALLRQGERFDVIVSDLDMPQVNGVDVFEAAERLSPNSRRILFTGTELHGDTINAHAVISKLDPMATLRGVIELAMPDPEDADSRAPRTTMLRIATRCYLDGRD